MVYLYSMASCQPVLNHRTRNRDEKCEVTWRDRANEIIANHRMGEYPNCAPNPSYLCEVGIHTQRSPLHCDKAHIEADLRNGCSGNILTHDRTRRNLPVRTLRTVPMMGSCITPLQFSDTYSQLVSGESTRAKKACNTLAGVTIDRFIPLVPCLEYNIQNPVHYVPQYWVRGGMDTRAYIRNIDYKKACGFRVCETECQQNFCRNQTLPQEEAVKRGQIRNLPVMP